MTSIKLGTFSMVRAPRNGLMTEQVVTQVRDMIHEGKLKPGDYVAGARIAKTPGKRITQNHTMKPVTKDRLLRQTQQVEWR
jgi:hypothetical protein